MNVDASASVDLSLTGNGVVGTSTNPSATYSGCVDVSAGLDVNLGADADFFDIFNPSTSVSVFDKTFDLYDVCNTFCLCGTRLTSISRNVFQDPVRREVSVGTLETSCKSEACPARHLRERRRPPLFPQQFRVLGAW